MRFKTTYTQEELDEARATPTKARVTVGYRADFSFDSVEAFDAAVPQLREAFARELEQKHEQRLKDIEEAQKKLDEASLNDQALLKLGAEMTFAQFARLYGVHTYGRDVEGMELIPSKRDGYSAEHVFAGKLDRLRTSDQRRVDGFDTMSWSLQNDVVGPLFSAKLKDITPALCFIRLVEQGDEVVPVAETTGAALCRQILGVAVKLGLIESNPASLKRTKKEAVDA